ncbi:MAG: glycoside hydrolase family 2 TIM barrel-domain containing protein, partial [Eubacteriales bacterium]
HDYMIETDVFADAPSRQASGYYNAGVAHYWRQIDIPAEWEGERIALRLDGAMMNCTIEVNGAKAALHHYGYAPFEADITHLVYPGGANSVVITVNPSMQPNSRWYSGAGLFRGVSLVHMPKLHIAFGGLSGYTKRIEYAPDGSTDTAYLKVSAEICNAYAENRLAEVIFELIEDTDGAVVRSSKTLTQVPPMAETTAHMTLTVDNPKLWSAEAPNLYRLVARVKDTGTYKTHIVPSDCPTVDEAQVLFGIRTIEADVKHGLRINGKVVKLKGGCLHHDNGVIGAVSLYDAEAWKVQKLKTVGFNAIRTTHNPPSAALIEACDRLGMYVFDEAFDAWGMGKQPGDYNQYFESDWQADLSAFVRRDRCHPSVILWSTGNEITERAGLNDGYVWATRLAEAVRALDPSRPVSNGICSFWNGLDDVLMADQLRRWRTEGSLQNADMGGAANLLWERYTEAFANGLD